MNQETTKVKTKKHSQLKNAVISSILDIFLIICYAYFIASRLQEPKSFNIESYNPIANILEIILLIITLIVLIILLIYSINVHSNTEKDDELSKLHRYKAGHISSYVTTILFAIIIFFVKDFSFAFTRDSIQPELPLIMIMTSSLITNITFIILEKFQLD